MFKIIQVIEELFSGLRFGYPLCCVIQYAVLSYQGKLPSWESWSKFNITDKECIKEAELFKYVQCDKCMIKYLEKARNEN